MSHEISDKIKNALLTLSQQTNEIVIITDENGYIEWVNKGFTVLTEYSFEEVIGKKPKMLQGPDTNPDTIKEISTALKQRKPIKKDILNYTKSGKPYWLRLFIRPNYDENKNLDGFVANEMNLTDQYDLRKKLNNLTHDLEKNIDETNLLINILSHDIKNLIYGSIDLCNILIMDNHINSAYGVQLVKSIEKHSEIVKNSLEDILKPSGYEDSHIFVKNIIKECVDKNSYKINSKNINIVVNINDHNAKVLTNISKLKICINNIINNATKFVEKNGTITINYKSKNEFHIFSVTDDGAGIEKDHLKRIRDSVKLHNKITLGTSIGYGLYIVNAVIIDLDGRLEIESAFGQFTTVHIYVPYL